MDDNDHRVRQALDGLESVVASASVWTSLDANGRAAYNRLAKKFSNEIWGQYKAGDLAADQAAKLANEARNEVMELIRARSSPWGRERAKAAKARGLTLEAAMDKYARQVFKKAFTS